MSNIFESFKHLTKQKTLSLFLAAIGFGLFAVGLIGQFSDNQASILDEVKARGYLRCGVGGGLSGFSKEIMSRGNERVIFSEAEGADYYLNAQGFEADFCRVIATAVFGEHKGRVAFRNFNVEERFRAVVTRQVDVLIRNTTWTLSRDVGYEIDFGPVIFHDGQKIITRKSLGIETFQELKDRRICVLENTTTFTNLARKFDELGIENDPVTRRGDDIWGDDTDISVVYFGGGDACDAWTGDASQLVSYLASQPEEIQNLHTILPLILSHEPLAPVVPAYDSRWHDVVNISVFVTMQAERLGISSSNIDSFDQSDLPVVRSFLESEEGKRTSISNQLGVPSDFTYQIVKQLGNYAEIYERHLGALIPERGDNQLYPAGRFQPPPF